jgi:putative ABC transport system substrate-binding protein
MERRTFIAVVSGGILAAPLAAVAQQTAKVYRLGLLGAGSSADPVVQRFNEEFRQALREIGYVDGHNVVIESREAQGKYERLPDLASELVSLKPDLIVAAPEAAAVAAKNATRTIPIVVVNAPDMVGSGLVSSLARPGGNVTGVSLTASDLTTKQLQLLKEAVPGLSRVAILRNSDSPPWAHPVMVKAAEQMAPTLRLKLHVLWTRGPDEFDSAFAIAREHADGLLVLPDAMFLLRRTRLVDLAAKSRLATMYPWRDAVDAGGLIAYGADLRYNWRRAATLVDKILKGAKPGDLPVEQPTKFELVINLKTAKALGLTIPPSVLQRADELIH